MMNHKLDYTRPDGERRRSAVAFDKPSADLWKRMLEEDGNTDVEIVTVRPGE